MQNTPRKNQKGQAILIMLVAFAIVLIGGLGLAIDGAHLYAQRQMAQVAADAAAQAGMMSIFDGTNTRPNNVFGAAQVPDCKSAAAITPCKYAAANGFGTGSNDTVTLDFGNSTSANAPAGVPLSDTDDPSFMKVTVARNVNTSLMRFLGAGAFTTVKATATAAIVKVESAVPILITDPVDPGTLSGGDITICGGPSQSIQVNSSSSTAYSGMSIDLSKAGSNDAGDCVGGTGADFGVWGPENNSGVDTGTTGRYIKGRSPIRDPLADVCPVAGAGAGCSANGGPAVPPAAPAKKSIGKNVDGCIQNSGCSEYSPGLYVGGIDTKSDSYVIFKPGLYYMQGGGFNFNHADGGGVTIGGEPSAMCDGCASDPKTGTGMVVYDTGSTAKPHDAAGFTIGQADVFLRGSTITTTDSKGNIAPGPPYYGILFWEDRTANSNTSDLGHSATAHLAFNGTIYITNTLALMNGGTEQTVRYNGSPLSATILQGSFIVGKLSMNGGSRIKMFLTPYSVLRVRQVSLVQ